MKYQVLFSFLKQQQHFLQGFNGALKVNAFVHLFVMLSPPKLLGQIQTYFLGDLQVGLA